MDLGTGKTFALGALALGLTLAVVPGPSGARKLNGPLPRADVSDVQDFLLTPDGERVLYTADADLDGAFALYARALAGGERPLRLHHALSSAQSVERFLVDGDSRRAVFFVRDRTFSGARSLFSAELDGSSPPLTLVSPFIGLPQHMELTADGDRLLYVSASGLPVKLYSLPVDQVAPPVVLSPVGIGTGIALTDFRQTAGGAHVVFTGNFLTFGRVELFCAPVDGGTPAVRLSGLADVLEFELTPDGASVVFRGQSGSPELGLFLAPLDGSSLPVRLTPNLPGDRSVQEFALSSDGTRIVYRGGRDAPDVQELFSFPLAAPADVVKISGTLVPAGAVQPGFQIAPDGRHVVYRADQEVDEIVELHATPIDGREIPVRLHRALAPGEEVPRFALAADGTRVVFTLRADQTELFSARLDGTGAVRLHDPLVPGGDVLDFELVGERVVYRADAEIDEVPELFGAPIDASAPSRRLHEALPVGRGVLPTLRFSADGRSVAFLTDLGHEGVFELYLAALDGSASARRISDPTAVRGVTVGDVIAAKPAGERAVYLADQQVDEVFELFSVLRDGSRGPVRLHPAPVLGGDVQGFEVSADGRWVLFWGDLDVDGRRDLYRARVDGSGAPVALLAPLGPPAEGSAVLQAALTPDSSRIVVRTDVLLAGQVELFSVPVEGGVPSRLDPAPHPSFGSARWFSITPDASRVVYASDKERRGRVELYSVPVDGSAAARRLSAVTAPGGDVHQAFVSADSSWVVYRADQDVNDVLELYAVPVDGGLAPAKLHRALSGTEDVGSPLLAGGQAIFRIVDELLHASIDGAGPSGPFFPPGVRTTQFWVTPGGTCVLAKARLVPGGEYALFSAPADASAAPTRLVGALLEFEDLHSVFFPDEATVLYVDPNERATMRAALDGRTPPREIDRTAWPVALSDDGSLVLAYGSSSHPPRDPYAYLVPADGSAPAVRLGPLLSPGGSLAPVGFAGPDEVLLLAIRERQGPRELYLVGAPTTLLRGLGR